MFTKCLLRIPQKVPGEDPVRLRVNSLSGSARESLLEETCQQQHRRGGVGKEEEEDQQCSIQRGTCRSPGTARDQSLQACHPGVLEGHPQSTAPIQLHSCGHTCPQHEHHKLLQGGNGSLIHLCAPRISTAHLYTRAACHPFIKQTGQHTCHPHTLLSLLSGGGDPT